jgi:hypothetical protein
VRVLPHAPRSERGTGNLWFGHLDFLPSSPRVRFRSILRVPDGEKGEGRALPGLKAVGIVSGLMEAETARPTVALNAANNGHYGEQKHS